MVKRQHDRANEARRCSRDAVAIQEQGVEQAQRVDGAPFERKRPLQLVACTGGQRELCTHRTVAIARECNNSSKSISRTRQSFMAGWSQQCQPSDMKGEPVHACAELQASLAHVEAIQNRHSRHSRDKSMVTSEGNLLRSPQRAGRLPVNWLSAASRFCRPPSDPAFAHSATRGPAHIISEALSRVIQLALLCTACTVS